MEIARGGSPRPIQNFLTDDPNGINWIKIGDTSKTGKYINSTKEKIIPEGMKKSRFVHKGDFLLTNSMSFGRPYILNIDGCIHDGWLVISNIYQLYSMDYLYYLLSSPFAHSQFSGKVSGAVVKNLNSNKVADSLFPLPPLSEQKRIVRRIEFLEPYVEEYDKAETELSVLNETFPEQIKKSILQYAIQGKLVPQDPNDEPASVLLEKIKAEKQKLIKAGKVKKDKVESYIYKRDNRHYEKIGDKEVDITDEIPFEIPPSWAWVRFKNLVHYRMGKTPQRKNEQFWEHGTFPWVSIADLISDGMLERTKEKISDYAVSQIFKGEFSPRGTLLMSFKLTVGKVSVLNINAVHNEAIISIYPYLNTDNSMRDYLFKFMPLLSQEGRTKTAIKGKTLNSDSIDALLIPLPPVAEQKRIVTKMDKLLSLFPTHN